MATLTKLNFEDQMRVTLKEYGELDDQISKLKFNRDEKKEQLRSWMDMHSLKEHETMDSANERFWRMQIIDSSSTKTDWEYLATILTPEQLEKAKITTPTERFDVRPVKSKRKKDAREKAPTETRK